MHKNGVPGQTSPPLFCAFYHDSNFKIAFQNNSKYSERGGLKRPLAFGACIVWMRVIYRSYAVKYTGFCMHGFLGLYHIGRISNDRKSKYCLIKGYNCRVEYHKSKKGLSMEFLVNALQMKKYDSGTIQQLGIPALVLMERAALCVVEEMERAGYLEGQILVVCGAGNNGGDGFAVARLLAQRGACVTAAFVGKEEALSEEARIQKKICENCGIKISTNFRMREYTTIVDAIFGIGLSRAIEEPYFELIEWMNRQPSQIVAVDIPSGVSADTGQVLGTAVRAGLTVTFAYRKIGQLLYPGASYCGKIVCRDIGISAGYFTGDENPSDVFTYTKKDLAGIPKRRPYSNKGTYGKVLLIAGSKGMSGAACLAARSAYRTGCGLVRVFTPESNRQVIQTYLPEAIVTAWDGDSFPEQELQTALAWSDVAGIGPGLGTGEIQRRILTYVLTQYDKPLVIDADGLNLLAKEIEILKKALSPVILTPHVGEMERLTNTKKEVFLKDTVNTVRRFSKEYKAVCALKDARTLVSDGVSTYVNTSGNSGMATGGSGDVLTGIVLGLLSQGMPPFEAASVGVYLHGLAGDEACRKQSAYGMLAGDIAEEVGVVLKAAEMTVEKAEA